MVMLMFTKRFLALCSLAGGLLAFPGWDAAASDAAKDGKRTFYVDSATGQDDGNGLAPATAWRSLERVNAADLQPGDTVRFKSGCTWRGCLAPVSGDEGTPVTYTSFGEGPKPLILGSLSRNRPEDWVKVRENIWATLPVEYQVGKPVPGLQDGQWTRHQEAGAKVLVTSSKDPAGAIVHVACTQSGSAANHVQLWGPTLPIEKDTCLLFTFRIRSSKPFRFRGVTIQEGSSPWTRLTSSRRVEYPVTAEWTTCQMPMQVTESSRTGKLHLALGGSLPAGAAFDFQPQSVCLATPPAATEPLPVDVGNVIFDEGAVCGWKKWSLDDLKKPYDYYYEGSSQRVYLCTENNPAGKHRSIELAMARHIINQGGKHDVVYDGLALKYGASHGFGGGGTHHLVIRNCDLGYIGGAHQLTKPNGTPVRFGNAIEFWGAAHDNLVEGCRIWQVYDAALTNQGRGPTSKQINITYRNNLILNSEYSFEYWNNPETAVTQNIRFVNNTCVNAGTVWSHEQRPNPNGSHLMLYSNTAETSGIEVKYNIFYNATDWGSRYTNGWKVLPDMDCNLWFTNTGVMAYWFKEKIGPFDEYRQKTKLDAHSQFADPGFVDAAKGDFRLKPDSPARKIRPDGGPVGAEMLWK
jgi:hypothetical protein